MSRTKIPEYFKNIYISGVSVAYKDDQGRVYRRHWDRLAMEAENHEEATEKARKFAKAKYGKLENVEWTSQVPAVLTNYTLLK